MNGRDIQEKNVVVEVLIVSRYKVFYTVLELHIDQ